MTATGIADDVVVEAVELLWFVADLCEAQASAVSAALCQFVGIGYDAGDLREDSARLAGVMARAAGLADTSGQRVR